MKKTFIFLSMLSMASISYAQTYFFADFNDESMAGWTKYDSDGDGYNWGDTFKITNTAGAVVSPISLISRSWQTSPLTPDNWAVSPEIDLTNASGPVILTWKVAAAAAEWDQEHYSVYVATDKTIAALTASSTTFSETYNDPADLGTQYTRELDLSSFAGQKIYVAFRHHNVTDMDYLSIDDVTVKAPDSTVPNCATLVTPANEATGVSYTNNLATLTWSAPTTGSSVSSYDLYFGTDANNLTLLKNVTAGTTSTTSTTVTVTSETTYYWKVVPKNSIGSADGCEVRSFTTMVNPFGQYCGPITYGTVEPISYVNLTYNTANTSSAATSGATSHEIFTDKIFKVEKAGSPEIKINSNTGGNFRHYYTVFIDWNKDGDFDDANEKYFTTSGTFIGLTNSPGTSTDEALMAKGTIVVPANAELGQTRMRIKAVYGATASPSTSAQANMSNPCANTGSSYGQAEDYTIEIVPEGSLSVTDIVKPSISLYPNPVKDMLNISDVRGISIITISDYSGRQLQTYAATKELNLSNLKKGAYVLTIKYEDGTIKSSKIIKD